MNKAVAEGPFADFGWISISSVVNRGMQSVCSGENEGNDGRMLPVYIREQNTKGSIGAKYWPPRGHPRFPVRNFPFSPRYAHPSHVGKLGLSGLALVVRTTGARVLQLSQLLLHGHAGYGGCNSVVPILSGSHFNELQALSSLYK